MHNSNPNTSSISKLYKGIAPELKLKRFDCQVHKAKLSTSRNANEYFRALFDEDTMEVCESFIVVYTNRANITIAWFKASQGGITGTVVDIRLVLHKALECFATGMVVAHNHPSGNLLPSESDRSFTRRLKEAAAIMDIALTDSLILTVDSFTSFADEGWL